MDDDPHQTVWSAKCGIMLVGCDRYRLGRCLDAIHSIESAFSHARRKKTIPASNGLFACDADDIEIATLTREPSYVRLDLSSKPKNLSIFFVSGGSRLMRLSTIQPDRSDLRSSFLRALTAARSSLADALDESNVLSEKDIAEISRRSLGVIGTCSQRGDLRTPVCFSASPGGPTTCAVRREDGSMGPNLLTARERAAWSMAPFKVIQAGQGNTLFDFAIGPHHATSDLGDPIALIEAIRSLPTVPSRQRKFHTDV